VTLIRESKRNEKRLSTTGNSKDRKETGGRQVQTHMTEPLRIRNANVPVSKTAITMDFGRKTNESQEGPVATIQEQTGCCDGSGDIGRRREEKRRVRKRPKHKGPGSRTTKKELREETAPVATNPVSRPWPTPDEAATTSRPQRRRTSHREDRGRNRRVVYASPAKGPG